ncbi:leucine-rich repeat protein [Oscillospiraceae bacterium OttesenSCG-928-F05]|nr:leucine-rich repeat protein [Oscillospiraceae bacterium OttesenSCG-928-F05]
MEKRVLSFALALVMCLALLPSAALAADSDFVIENGVLLGYNGSGGNVVIPDGVTQIGTIEGLDRGGVWSGTQSPITSVTIPNSVTTIGAAAFLDRGGLIKITSVTIPNSVTTIGRGAFRDLSTLTSVTIGNGIKSLTADTGAYGEVAHGGVFVNCENLTNVTFVDGLTIITDNMFENCTSLKSIVIPDSVTSIGDNAFSNCKSLASVTIGNGVTNIGAAAFLNCSALTTITIPESVTSIGYGTFDAMDNTHTPSYPLPNLTIICAAGSAAETYVKESGNKYEITGDTTNPPPALDLTSASTWAQEGITNAVAANLVPQNLQSAYTQATTRAEFAALAVALYEQVKGAEITERKTFDDTNDINVEKAAAIGIVSGVGDNKFDPNSGLTREQAAVMLARLANVIGKPLDTQPATFADNSSIATWAIVEVGQIQAAGIMSGVGENTFAPQSAYTREQSIVTILRLYDVVK